MDPKKLEEKIDTCTQTPRSPSDDEWKVSSVISKNIATESFD